jgi:hypothetical protein
MSEYRRQLAWKAGAKAWRDGKPKSSCTRQRGTIFWDDWHDGFEHAENHKAVSA